MISNTKLSASVCAAALLTASGAQADVTAAQVWENWKESFTVYGEGNVQIGSETVDGGTLTVDGIMIASSDDQSSIEMDMGTLIFEEQGDGTVRVTTADSYPIKIDDMGTELEMTVLQNDMQMVVSGTPESMNYDFSVDTWTFSIDAIRENGEAAVDGDMLITMNNVVGAYVSDTGNLQNIASRFEVGSIDLLADLAILSAPGDTVVISGKVNNLTFDGNMSMPLDMETMDPDQIFAAGFAIDGQYSVESANYIFDIDADGEKLAGTASNAATAFQVAMSQDAFLYDVATQDVSLEIVSQELPFPISVSVDEYAIGFGMPLSASEEPEDFALLTKIVNLAVNDEIWMLGDPSGALPREAATFILDLSGQGRLFYDITNPEEMAAVDNGAVPGEVNNVNLNELQLTFGGANVTGDGSFTFDNSDMVTFDGIPRPEGSVTIDIEGANQLMGALVQMGLLPEDQMMMAQMMVGMFAQQTGDDSLTTTLEINDQGHVLANGQRLQ